jgi:hypothetical protein
VCVYVSLLASLPWTGRCVCGALCSENDTGQKGEWLSACFTTLAVEGCSRSLLVYLFIRFAFISYGRFIPYVISLNAKRTFKKGW